MGEFKDHFSGHAGDYASFRPGYSAALYRWLADVSPSRECAWDCATGNGQAALGLAQYFRRVVATDASKEQIEHAVKFPTIEYRTETAEQSSLPSLSVDLVTVAQACHWFRHEEFLREVERVIRPRGVLAVWTYTGAEVSASIDAIVNEFYNADIGPYWPPERKLVEQGYANLSFPWPELPSPRFVMEVEWGLESFAGYLQTWSAVRRYMADTGCNPVAAIHSRLSAAWGKGQRKVIWPQVLRAFRVA